MVTWRVRQDRAPPDTREGDIVESLSEEARNVCELLPVEQCSVQKSVSESRKAFLQRAVGQKLKQLQRMLGSAREYRAPLTIANLTDTEAWTLLDSLAAHIFKLIRNAH